MVMPWIIDLGSRSQILRDVNLIVGEGLCSNIYVIGGEQVVIVDTGVGNHVNPIWPQLKQLGVESSSIASLILTHAHHDHAMGAFIILDRAEPTVYVHRLDSKLISSDLGPKLVRLEEGDIVPTDLWPLEVIWTPGHTEGSICLYARQPGILFSGDTIFPDGYFGRYDGETGSYNALIKSLQRLSEMDVEVMLPGHGMPVIEDAQKHVLMSFRNASLFA